jgi:hypothetical protein
MNVLRRVKGYFIVLDSTYRLKVAISSSPARCVGDVVHVISQLSPNGCQGEFFGVVRKHWSGRANTLRSIDDDDFLSLPFWAS